MTTLHMLSYADGMVLMSTSTSRLQQMLGALSSICGTICMQVNVSKTEMLVLDVPSHIMRITLSGVSMPRPASVKYA